MRSTISNKSSIHRYSSLSKSAIHKIKSKWTTANKQHRESSNWCCFKTNSNSNISVTATESQISTECSESKSLSPTNSLSTITKTPSVLVERGYVQKNQIAATLQGEVFIAETSIHRKNQLICAYMCRMVKNLNTEISVVCSMVHIIGLYYCHEIIIKRTDKSLHFQSIAILPNGAIVNNVKEDIRKEAQMLKMFLQNNPPKVLIRFVDFFQDCDSFYLAMEKGGKGLFQFTQQCHELIKNGQLSIKHWRKSVRCIFIKLVEAVHWMHNVVHCCSLDISLENVVVGSNTYFDEDSGEIRNLDIRVIDFGLTEMFEENSFICDKYVGKTAYNSFQVYQKRLFMANKADVWALGVCLFMLSFGVPPFPKPSLSNAYFKVFAKGQMKELLRHWNLLHYVQNEQYDLIMKMICIDERQRLSIDEVKSHVWISRYFTN